MATWKFLLTVKDSVVSPVKKAEVKKQILQRVEENSMGPYYKHLCKSLGWMEDEELSKKMSDQNTKELKEFDGKIEEAKATAGETEIREAELAKAHYLAKIGEKKLALEAFEATLEKTVGIGGQIDIIFAMIRMGLAWSDNKMVKEQVEKAKSHVEKGGDWERRNLLGVYESTYLITCREFKEAADKLLDSLATFTCYKLFDYETFIFYTVITSLISIDRVSLRKKVVKSPEILSVIDDIPNLRPFLFGLYQCKYKELFHALASITKQIQKDMYLAPHCGYFMREIRIVAYSQFLESYRSVTVESMAVAFGVSTDFLDKELFRFISAGRLNCKIDKVGGIVETCRPDKRNSQYTATIKQGDLLLNRIQKLTKIMNY